MRTRTFTAVDLVGLPNLDSRSLVALTRSLDAAAPEKDEDKKPLRSTLPESVREALADMDSARDALQAELEKEPPPPPGAREADRREDNAALALIELLGAWARLSGEIPQGDVAAQVFERLFGNGSTAFINFPVKKEWAVIEGKLKVVEDEGLEEPMKKLGALPVLSYLRAVHDDYGKAIGTTKAAAKVESPQLRARREELADAVRTYVVRAVAMRDTTYTSPVSPRFFSSSTTSFTSCARSRVVTRSASSVSTTTRSCTPTSAITRFPPPGAPGARRSST